MFVLLFWVSLSVLAYTYIGYPLLLWFLSKYLGKNIKKEYIYPKVTAVVVVYNEALYIERKIQNILSLDYPKDCLDIVVASDGSTDATEEIVKKYQKYGVRLFSCRIRQGKPNLLRQIISQLKGEIVLFTDARQRLKKNALKQLVANFADNTVGCVSGELIFEDENYNGVAKNLGIYWHYEKLLRGWESKLDSMLGATGAIYAVRRDLLVSPIENIILDDVFIPLKIVEKGYRAIFDNSAKAYDRVAYDYREEFRRKVRTLTGNFQLFWLCPHFLNPLKSRIAWQLISHKVLRAYAFFPLFGLFISSALLIDIPFYEVFFILQFIFYSLAFFKYILNSRSKSFYLHSQMMKLLHLPFVFSMLNIASLVGWIKFLFGQYEGYWEKARREKASLENVNTSALASEEEMAHIR